MYKKFLILGALIASSLATLSLHTVEVLHEVRAAYYYPVENRFRDIYSGGFLYGFEVSIQPWEKTEEWRAIDDLYVWSSLGILYASGSSLKEHDETQLFVVPAGLGLKYFFNYKCIKPYLGAGIILAYGHIQSDSSAVIRNVFDANIGAIAKSGVLYYVNNCVFFDLFLDYTYLKMNFNNSHLENILNRRVDLSGLSIGGGFGYRF